MKLNRLALAVMGILSTGTAQAFDVTFNTQSNDTSVTINWDESFSEALTLHYGNTPDTISSGTSVTVEQGANSVILNHLDYDFTYYFKLSRIVDEQQVFSNQTGVGFVAPQPLKRMQAMALVNAESSMEEVRPAVTNDGRYVAFVMEDDASEVEFASRDQLYLYDRRTGKRTLVSMNPETGQLSETSVIADVQFSGDGRYLFFSSQSHDLLSSLNSSTWRAIYRYELSTGALQLLLKDAEGQKIDSHINWYDITADGSKILFQVDGADNILGFPDINTQSIMLYTVETDTYEYVSQFEYDRPHTYDILTMSSSGNYVAFRSGTDELFVEIDPSVEGNTDAVYGIIAKNMTTGEYFIPSRGFQFNGEESRSSRHVRDFEIDDDGNVFMSRAFRGLFYYSHADGVTTELEAQDERLSPQIDSRIEHEMSSSDDGNKVAFSISRSDADVGSGAQAVSYDRGSNSITFHALNDNQEYGNGSTDFVHLSGNGDFVAFMGHATNLDDIDDSNDETAFVTVFDNTDSDADGIVNVLDQAPTDAGDWLDSDGDGIANHLEDDADADGVSDTQEAFWGLNPVNAADGSHDVDGDSLSAAQEAVLGSSIFLVDTDSDTYNDNVDAFPTDSNEWLDTDGDGIGNNADEDDDNDGFNDDVDVFPLDVSEWLDTDNDGIGNNADNDDDNDGVNDANDAFPLDETESVDTDGDGIGNNADTDDDNDGVFDEDDAFPLDETESVDTDGDGIGDNSDPDLDGDSIANIVDCSPNDTQDAKRCVKVQFDFDGDGSADIAVRRPSNVHQYIKNSDDEEIQRIIFGKRETDIPVSGDFDGDGIADVAVRRASDQFWYVKNSSGIDHISGNDDGISRIRFGLQATDIPVPADFDGDGMTDLAVRRPSDHFWYIKNSSGIDAISGNSDGITRIKFGRDSGDIPVVADFDGDGKADLAVYRPSTTFWYVLNSSGEDKISGNADGISRKQFGKQFADTPVPGDYNGDGIADFALYRPSEQTWYVLNSTDTDFNSSEIDDTQQVEFGVDIADIPISADYDGDGVTDFAVRSAGEQTQYILRSSDGETTTLKFGLQATDIPLAAPVTTRMTMAEAADSENK